MAFGASLFSFFSQCSLLSPWFPFSLWQVACLNPLRKAAAEVQQGLTCPDESLVGVHAPLLGTK
jgi:hypothetical protein